MNHPLRYPLATAICIIGGAVLAFAVAIPYVLFLQPAIERPTDVSLPQWIRATLAFILVFVAVYLSSFVLPAPARRRSSIVSGVVLVLCFLCIVPLLPGSASFSRLAVAVSLDLAPIILAVILSARLHACNVT